MVNGDHRFCSEFIGLKSARILTVASSWYIRMVANDIDG